MTFHEGSVRQASVAADLPGRQARGLGSGPQGATHFKMIIPGRAKRAQIKKKVVQPVASTMKPVLAFANVRGIPMTLVSRAY